MAISDLFLRFKKQVETLENHKDELLKTHYYKGNFNQIFTSIEQIFRQDADCRISTISKDHGEIAVEVNKPFPCFLIITVINVKPLETAIDFTISSEKTSLFGIYPILRKRINTYYERINKVNTFIR